MSDWRDWYYEPTTRREARGGIKAKSQRGQIGETWWSRRFISILESFDIGARLSRGRSYARSGQVTKLEVTPGLVTAKVQGSRPAPYKVRIEIKVLSESDWSRVEEMMAGQALFMAKLFAGEMPHDIEEAFNASRLKLFPASTRDLETDCNCPDWSNPCKHLAAAYYILAEKFDEDPFLILAWRGRQKEQLIGRLRTLRGSIAEQDDSVPEQERLDLPEDVAPLADCLSDFWGTGLNLSGLHISPRAAALPDVLLRQLGPLPLEAGGRWNVADILEPAYKRMTAAAERKAFGGPT
jgi:uncharacterized Zn finger protein